MRTDAWASLPHTHASSRDHRTHVPEYVHAYLYQWSTAPHHTPYSVRIRDSRTMQTCITAPLIPVCVYTCTYTCACACACALRITCVLRGYKAASCEKKRMQGNTHVVMSELSDWKTTGVHVYVHVHVYVPWYGCDMTQQYIPLVRNYTRTYTCTRTITVSHKRLEYKKALRCYYGCQYIGTYTCTYRSVRTISFCSNVRTMVRTYTCTQAYHGS